MEKIVQISSLCAAILTVAAILFAVVVCLVRLIKKAKEQESPGGKKITSEEWVEIIVALLPFGVKILNLISKASKEEERKEEEKSVRTPAPEPEPETAEK